MSHATALLYHTGAQEWYIVSLLGDVTSPTTVSLYVSMTPVLRILITEKHWQPRRQHTVYRNNRLEFATKQVGKLRYVTAVDGGLKRFPSVAWFAHPCSTTYAQTLHAINGLLAVGRVGNLLCGRPSWWTSNCLKEDHLWTGGSKYEYHPYSEAWWRECLNFGLYETFWDRRSCWN